MNDQELLEQAALASGIEGVYQEWRCYGPSVYGGIGPKGCDGSNAWNPLVNRDDCLQMETDLKFCIDYQPIRGGWVISRFDGTAYKVLSHDQDRQRASVMAAAEIGKSMQSKYPNESNRTLTPPCPNCGNSVTDNRGE